MGRQQLDAFNLINGALGFGVERPEGFDLVVEEFDAVGELRAHRVDVQDRAPHRVFAVLLDIVRVPVTGGFQTLPPFVDGQRVPGCQQQGVALGKGRRRQAVHQGPGRQHQQAPFQPGQLVEGADTLRDDRLMGGEHVVRQCLPVRQ